MEMNGTVQKPKEKFYQVKAKDYNGARDFFDKRKADGCFTVIFDYKEEVRGEVEKGMYNAIRFIAKAEVVLPQWREASKLKGVEAKNWKSLLSSLRKHEIAHFEMFKLDVLEMVKNLEAKPDMTKAEIKKEMQTFLKTAQDNQDKFDKARDHGAKDGVRLPPVK